MSQASLVLMKEGQVLKTIPLESEMLLGRSTDCAICLNDPSISRRHALFIAGKDGLSVRQKSEFSPLFVNGAECSEAVLKEGDILSLGPYLIRVSMAQAVSQSMAQALDRRAAHKVPSLPVEVDDVTLDEPPPSDVAVESVTPTPALEQGLESTESPSPEIQADLSPELEVTGTQVGPEEGEPSQENPLDASSQPPTETATTSEAPQEIQIAMDTPPAVSFGTSTDLTQKTEAVPVGNLNVKLVFQPGTANVTEYRIEKEDVAIGRGDDCDIILNDPEVSRRNSVIRRMNMDFVIQDLGSANGTFVNGIPVEVYALSGGDVIRIGKVEFSFIAESKTYAEKEKGFLEVPSEVPSSPQELQSSPVPGEIQGGGEAEQLRPPGMPPHPKIAGQIAGVVPGTQSIPEFSGTIPGITESSNQKKRKTLLERFRALPRRTQIIAIIAILFFLNWLLEDDNTQPKKSPTQRKVPTVGSGSTSSGDKPNLTFEGLTPEQKRFVENEHALAFDYYKNKEYDKAIFEIQKVLALVSDYKDAKEIERYAREGKRKLEIIEEERRKREEEARVKAKIAELVDLAKIKMDKKAYEEARKVFADILALDPDNEAVNGWRKEIEDYEARRRVQEQQRLIEEQINAQAWKIYREGLHLSNDGKFLDAIGLFQKVPDTGTKDKNVLESAKRMITNCREALKGRVTPLLADGKEAESSGEFRRALESYLKALEYDPDQPDAQAGIRRVKGVLHDRAKGFYTEAVIAESYSDFATAKKMFQECLKVAPPDDIYHERAERKLSHYFKSDEGQSQ